MKITKTTVPIGLAQPFTALHLSDTHIALADERDDERKRELAKRRFAEFNAPTGNYLSLLDEQLAYAKSHGETILYTGDLYDFVSYRNLKYARERLSTVDHFLCAGNHEYSQYVGEAFEDVPYRMQTYALVQAFYQNNLMMDHRIMGGINFVGIDNGYYRFDEGQLKRLKHEVDRGLPIVMMIHNPLHTDQLYRDMMALGHPCAYLVGTPKALMGDYGERRLRQQFADEATRAFIDYVYHEPAIRAVLAGHLHFDFEVTLPSGIPQIVTGTGYRDCAREITFV